MFQDALANFLRRSKQARNAFKRNMAPPSFRGWGELVIWPSDLLREFPSIAGDIGRAYDHWIRFVAIVLNRMGEERICEFRGIRAYEHGEYAFNPGLKGAIESCLSALSTAYGSRDLVNDDLLRAMIFLGYFEREYRTGAPVTGDLRVSSELLDELRKLVVGSDTSWLRGIPILNPVFSIQGDRGILEGDGDILIERTLWEIKTLSEFRPLETLRQLLGYVVMNSMATPQLQIDAVGLYFVRFGKRAVFDLLELTSTEGLGNLREYFQRKIGSEISRFTSQSTN